MPLSYLQREREYRTVNTNILSTVFISATICEHEVHLQAKILWRHIKSFDAIALRSLVDILVVTGFATRVTSWNTCHFCNTCHFATRVTFYNTCYFLQHVLLFATSVNFCNMCYFLKHVLLLATRVTSCNTCYFFRYVGGSISKQNICEIFVIFHGGPESQLCLSCVWSLL
jgi:hypothetical protein